MRFEIHDFESGTTHLKTSTIVAFGNNLQKGVREFTQQLRGIATNIHALTSCAETVELHAVENEDSNITDLHQYKTEKLAFEIYDPCGIFPNLKYYLSLVFNNLESVGGNYCNGKYFSHYK